MGTSAKRPIEIGDADERLIDIRRIVAIARHRQWWILGTFALLLAIDCAAYFLTPATYTANASVALDRRVDEIVASQAKSDAALTTDSPSVDTAVTVLTSPLLASEVVDALRLGSVPGIGQPISGPAISAENGKRRATLAIQNNLTVKRTGLSYAIVTSYRSTDPVLAAKIVNRLVDQYVEDQRSGKVGARGRETALLRDRLATLRGDVLRAEAAVARYRASTNLIDVNKDSTAIQQEISVLNTQLATADADSAAARSRLAAARANGAIGSGDAAHSSVMSGLRSQQAQLSAQRADLAGRYGPLHPDLAKIDRQLEDLSRSLVSESVRIRANLQAEASVAGGRAEAIRASLSRAQGGLMAGNNASVQLNELERNAESARVLYQSLLDRYKQTVTGEGTEQSNAYVIGHALVPSKPTSPNPVLYVVGGLIAAVLAASAVVLLLEMLEAGFLSRHDVESKLGVPVVGTVPDLATVPGARASRGDPMGPANFLINNEGSIFGESFRSIRTGLRLGHEATSPRSLAVCSALPAEGKTTISICLARSAALAGLKVVLVDCDVRRRASTLSVGSETSSGVIEVLEGKVRLENALVRDTPSGAWILGQSSQGSSSFEILISSSMSGLIALLSKQFDLVILDTAPVLPLAEARSIASMADGVLLVTRWRKTPVQATRLALEMLGRAGANVVGVALAQVNIKQQSRFGQGDELAYYNNFKEYYS